jgi:hypothetical protein
MKALCDVTPAVLQNRTYLQGTTLSSILEMEGPYNPNMTAGSLKYNLGNARENLLSLLLKYL